MRAADASSPSSATRWDTDWSLPRRWASCGHRLPPPLPNDPDPSRAIAAVDLFAVQGADTIGASVAYFLFESDGPARYASAGHVPSVLVPRCAPALLLEEGRRALLGFQSPDNRSVAADVAFDPGDVIVMFTDGLVERRGEGIDDGLHRLGKTIEQSATCHRRRCAPRCSRR
jgi:hypothetical protein